jgi:poly-gamma-glutamate synthesis protein (capsule biosynthesis protein)
MLCAEGAVGLTAGGAGGALASPQELLSYPVFTAHIRRAYGDCMNSLLSRLLPLANLRRHPRQSADRLLAAVILILLAIAFRTAPPVVDAAAAVTPYPHDLAQVSFAIAGDVIPHEAVRQAAAATGQGTEGWAGLFSEVSDLFKAADFGFVNLETPVAPTHSHGTKPFLFDAPIDLPTALQQSGIKIVSFANNHAMDQGWAGFAETREHLKELGLLFAGTSDTAATSFQPVITEAHGIKVGWLGMTRWLNGGRNPDKPELPHVNFFPYAGEPGADSGATEEQVLAAVKSARAQCDLLVVSIHWGVEYATAPRAEDVELAHKIMEAGASVIVGHHPHVLQAVETYRTHDVPASPDGSKPAEPGRDTVIFYSLGNFLSNQSRTYVDGLMPDSTGDPRDSLIGLFSAVRRDYGPAGTRVELGHVGILPVWGENNRNQMAQGKAKSALIRPVLIDREIPRLQARLDELTRMAAAPADDKSPAAGKQTEAAQQPEAAKGPETEKAEKKSGLTADQKKEFIELTTQLKLLIDRRAQILNRTGDEFLQAPPKLALKAAARAKPE